MGQYDITQTNQTDMNTVVTDFSPDSKSIDEASDVNETVWENVNWNKWLGYYKSIPELLQAINSFAVWVAGKGFTTKNVADEVMLGNITGWGEDTIQSILENMIIVKKINGDSFAEIIRNPDTGKIINLKPLNPVSVKTVVSSEGIIVRYEEIDMESGKSIRKINLDKMFHLSNNRIANEIHGNSLIEPVEWVVDTIHEAMRDYRRMLHRSTIRVLYVEEEDKSRHASLKRDYANAIKHGELMIMPGKASDNPLQDFPPPNTPHLEWIRYLKNVIFQDIGTPEVIMGGSPNFTNAGEKMGYLTFEQPVARGQRELEQDMWNQLGIRIVFNKPISLKDNAQETEAANTGQIGTQPVDTGVGAEGLNL